MIPDFVDGCLPAGIYHAARADVEAKLGWNEHRRLLLAGFGRGVSSLAAAGCTAVWLDGSFVTTKEHPEDFDACWDTEGVAVEQIDPVLRQFDRGRRAQKLKFRGEFMPNGIELASGMLFLEFFQMTRDGGTKGIIQIDPEAWT